MKKSTTLWLLSLLSIFILFATGYFVAHYVLRSNANQPQIQIAEDTAWSTALQLEKNGKIAPLAIEKIDVGSSQDTFVIVYNKNEEVMESTGTYNNEVPKLPSGVLESVDLGEKNIFTWEPVENVRIAAVVVSSGKYGYVLVGRSLTDTEDNIAQLNKTVFVLFCLSIVVVSVGFYVFNKTR